MLAAQHQDKRGEHERAEEELTHVKTLLSWMAQIIGTNPSQPIFHLPSLLADRILKNEPGARERYLDLLRAGGADDAYLLVKAAGVDLATPAPYQALVARMNRIMDEIEAILARRGLPAK